MRIAVTGAGGGVGRAFLEQVPREHDVHTFTHDALPVEDRGAVMERLIASRPEVVLHLAAMTAVDDCERDPDAAFRVNALGTANVALAARATGSLLVALSTDYVFDGTKGEPYHEYDPTNPLSVYGRSKLAGEREARLAPDHLIVRTAWVFGGGDDFLSRSVPRLAAGESVGAIVDRTGTPTYVRHLAERLLPLASSGLRGVVHLGGPEPLTWFDLLARAREAAGLPGQVTEVKEADLGRPAQRPADSSLVSLVIGEQDLRPMPPIDDAILDLMGRLRGRG